MAGTGVDRNAREIHNTWCQLSQSSSLDRLLLGTHDLWTQVIFSTPLRNRKEKYRKRSCRFSFFWLLRTFQSVDHSVLIGSHCESSSVLSNEVTVGNNKVMHGEAKLLSEEFPNQPGLALSWDRVQGADQGSLEVWALVSTPWRTPTVTWGPSPSSVSSLRLVSWATVILSVSVLAAAEVLSKASDLLWRLVTKTESGFQKWCQGIDQTLLDLSL